MRIRQGLTGALEEYARSDYYPLHMPGHKRRLKGVPGRQEAALGQPDAMRMLEHAAAFDITEIEGFDNLHEPAGLLKEAMERAARLYGADHTFYSVNGSTAGLLTAISAAVPEGGRLIMARSCHRAVYHAVYLRRLRPVYLYPGTLSEAGIADVIDAGQVEEALCDNPDAAAVLITSPTYDGITADVERIAGVAHRHGIPLIVDAAHGAHFGFHPGFPDSPVHQGADITVVSLHKTMPCMTQTALLHVKGDLVDLKRLRLFEGIYQTSSPSYILMAGMDACVSVTEEKGASLWDSFFEEREDFLRGVKGLRRLRVIAADASGLAFLGQRLMDPGKLLIDTSRTGMSGQQLYDELVRDWHLQPEMAAGDYVTAIMTCCDEQKGWQRLKEALLAIDGRLLEEAADGRMRQEVSKAESGEPLRAGEGRGTLRPTPYPRLEAVLRICDALDAGTQRVLLEEAQGRICGEFVNLYPPGIPIAVPGERLSEEAIALLQAYRALQLPLCGVQDGALEVIELPGTE